ncbi:type I-E CRISPR-associated protein Cse2/CasB [Aerococcaceae bacterium NML201209]|nr:type I-E CRISPR-associated protein Cse2/CasB [Aerococcaceae bacterium NML201209]
MTKSKIIAVTNKILHQLEGTRETSSGKALLAKMRRSVGKKLSETVEIWPFVFGYLPEEFIGDNEEKAIVLSMQFYSLHQQGIETSVLYEHEKSANTNVFTLGKSLSVLRTEDDRVAVDRRFNTMITATTFEELEYHLRHLLMLLKSKSRETKVDYAQLAEDLYWILRGFDENIRLKWARDYYRTYQKGENLNDN